MNKLEKLSIVFIVFTFTSALFCTVKAQAPAENMKTFFDSGIPGIKIQVNATAETQPAENITVMLSLKRQTTVYMEYFNLSIFGFLNGTDKVIMANITGNNFSLTDASKEYNCTFKVPENVWDVTYGEISLTYRADIGGLELRFSQITCGFTMTHVENIYLKDVEEQLKNLKSTYELLNQTFWELKQNYTALQRSLNELDNTRRAVAILAITTVFFVVTTVYLIMRKPKEIW